MAAILWAVLPASAEAVSIVNGDFEDVSSHSPGAGLANGAALPSLASGPGASWDVFTSIGGWTAVNGPGIEVQTNRTLGSIDAHSGEHYIELDSHTLPDSNTRMEQLLGSLAPGLYELSFFYSPRTNTAGSNLIDVAVSGAGALFSDLITEADGAVGVWTEITRSFLVPEGAGPVTLSFAAAGTEDTLGGFLDTVSISSTVSSVPLPPALPLLAAGIGLIALMRRRAA